MKWLLLVCILLLSSQTHASRERGFFIGTGFSLIDVGVDDFFDNRVNFKGVEVIAGYKYNGYLGLDVRYGLSPADESFFGGEDPDTGLDLVSEADFENFISYYYRPEIANDIAKLYLLLGQASVTITTTEEDGSSTTRDERANSWGVGFGLWVNRKFDVTFEYRQLLSTENESITINAVNIEYRF